MKLKLKEQPIEWQKFTGVMVAAAGAGLFLLRRRRVVSDNVMIAAGVLLALILLLCAIRPRWFRGFYRVGMTASFHMGQVMGWVALTMFFLVVLTPLALLLRLLGKDLLRLRRGHSTGSYWHPTRESSPFDRQF